MTDYAVPPQAEPNEPVHLPPAPPSSKNRSLHLPGRTTLPLRLIWMILLLGMLAVFVAGIPASYELLRAGTMGVLLEQNSDGQIVLTPIAGQPAEQAGVLRGDVLLAVDGVPVPVGESPANLRSRTSGAPGKATTLTIARAGGAVIDITFERSHVALTQLGISPDTYALVLVVVGVLFVAAYTFPAAVIALRRPRDRVAALVWLTLVLIAMFNSRANVAISFSDSAIGITIAAAYHVAVLLVLLTFPDGRLEPRWTRWYLPVGLLWIAIKLAPIPLSWAIMASPAWVLVDFLVYGVAVFAQLQRHRTATDPEAQQQTKWLVYGFVVAFLVQYAYYIPQQMVPGFQGRSVFEFVGSIVNHLLMLIVPIAFIHAVLRYRLYDIDLIINRTLVYVPLTAILAGIYTASVVLFRSLFISLTGENSDAAIVLSTVVIVAIISPLKDLMKKAVDERFRYASRADRVLKDFEVQIKDRMHAVQAGPLIRRLLEQSLRAFDAPGGAAYLVHGSDKPNLLCTSGKWNAEGVVRVRVRSGEQAHGTIELSPRPDGKPYAEADLERLRATAAVVAAAIEEDQNF